MTAVLGNDLTSRHEEPEGMLKNNRLYNHAAACALGSTWAFVPRAFFFLDAPGRTSIFFIADAKKNMNAEGGFCVL